MKFSFGGSERERIEVDVLGYEYAPLGEYHDDNWLVSRIRVRAGAFNGKVDASILTEELVAFLKDLLPRYETLRGAAEFSTMEEPLHLRLTGDGKGHIELIGDVKDRAGVGNRLHFSLRFCQSQFGAAIRELEKVAEEFPVRGTR